jgi:hypothetical protein
MSRTVLEKPVVAQPLRQTSSVVWSPKGSLPCSPATGLYPVPDESSPYLPTYFSKTYVFLPSWAFSITFSYWSPMWTPITRVLHALPSLRLYLATNTNYRVPHYAMCSGPLLIHPSWIRTCFTFLQWDHVFSFCSSVPNFTVENKILVKALRKVGLSFRLCYKSNSSTALCELDEQFCSLSDVLFRTWRTRRYFMGDRK